MRIGLDGLSITARPAGSGGVAMQLLAAMAREGRGTSIVAVLPRASAADGVVAALPGVEVIRAPVAGPDTLRALWFQHAEMPRRLRASRIDVHVGASFVLPLRDTGAPSVVVVHDVSWRLFSETKTARFRAYMDSVVPRSIRRAHAVVTGAESARREILEFAPDTDPSKVHVVPWGVTRRETRGAPTGVAGPYLLSVSNFDKRKNLPALVEAWRRLVRDDGLPHALVLVGDAERAAAFVREVGPAPDERLLTPGYVDADTLTALYAGADLVVVPSVYEGFGLPVLEAFAARAAVACSNAASLPEVAGDAAVLFDPTDPADMARGIREALRPGPARDARVERGRARAAAATWERCAESFLRVVRRAATSGRPDRA
jgi:glycosyltransferase involved in cell wall biosynthesis